jgi:subtilisin family serine protease
MDRYIILRQRSRSDARSDIVGPELRTGTDGVPKDNLPTLEFQFAGLEADEVDDVSADPEVEGLGLVMPTILLAPVMIPSETHVEGGSNDSWGIGAVRADISGLSGKNVSVCMLDTGIDFHHPAFQGVRLSACDFSQDSGSMSNAYDGRSWDVNGHGTHCGGTIFGRNVNGIRIGVARDVTKVLVGKVLDDRGRGTTEMLFKGLQWAISQSVDVVSMSIGFDFPGFVERRIQQGWSARQAASDALVAYQANLRLFDSFMAMVKDREAFNEGTVVVAASGNESDRRRNIKIAASVPAAARGVVSVGALGQAAGRYDAAYFSNTRPMVTAPGVNIKSAEPGGGLTELSGTSMACPHVAGVAALWWEYLRNKAPDGKATAQDVVAHLTTFSRQTDVFVDEFSRADFGAGLVTAPLTRGRA